MVVYLAICIIGVVRPGWGLFGPVRTAARNPSPHVALTYDDGPDPAATPQLLDLLAARGVQAAFFCIGRRVDAHPDLTRRCIQEGHLVGNHSHRHGFWSTCLLGRSLERELQACQQAVVRAAGAAPRFFRPPFGLLNHAMHPACRRLGLAIVGWQVRGLDTMRRPVAQVVDRILSRVRGGGIVLLHDGDQEPERVLEITERLLAGLATRGLSLVRLDRLLEQESCAGDPLAKDRLP
jgi:peptidoglycan/xylan/chitin deacetylase (PgdA/CDA1 family)